MITKKFSKSYDEALTQAYLFQSELVVDQAAFTAFSPLFASPFAADFLLDIQAADAIPTNEDDLNNQTVLSAEVEDQMVLAREQYQKLLLYVGFAWPNSEPKLKVFGNNQYEIARKSPPKMINLLQSSYLSANSVTYKAALIAAGFLQTDITLLHTIELDLTAKLNAQQDYIRHSFTRSEDRVVAFNKVWDTMVQISNASKYIFKDSPAKIEFYLLYPEGAGPGVLTPPTGLSFTLSNMKISWNSVTNATSYSVEISQDGVAYNEIYSGVETNFIYMPVFFGYAYLRCRARNASGYSDYSDVYNFSYYDVLPAPENLEISLVSGSSVMVELSWSAVLSADSYKIYRSVVNLDSPAGDYTYLTDQIGTVYTGNAVSGKRNWYVLKSMNATQMSDYSQAVYLDVAVVPV